MRLSDRDYNLGLVLVGCLTAQWCVDTLANRSSLWPSVAIMLMILTLRSSRPTNN